MALREVEVTAVSTTEVMNMGKRSLFLNATPPALPDGAYENLVCIHSGNVQGGANLLNPACFLERFPVGYKNGLDTKGRSTAMAAESFAAYLSESCLKHKIPIISIIMNGLKADQRLWYNTAAGSWNEALPIGCGNLAAMVFGGSNLERLALNHEEIWAGHSLNPSNPRALETLQKIRSLFLQGRIEEAEKELQENMMGNPNTILPYEPLGDLWISLHGHDYPIDYTRWLDLQTATAGVDYRVGKATFCRRYFTSLADRVIAGLWQAHQGKWPTMHLRFTREEGATTHVTGGTVTLEGSVVRGGLRFAAVLQLETDGDLQEFPHGLIITNAQRLEFRLAASTNYRNTESDLPAVTSRHLQNLAAVNWDDLLQAHEQKYQALYGRVQLQLNGETHPDWPTDHRLRHVRAGFDDIGLERLLFDYGRYLLICSSQPGGLPANLQGKWNPSLNPAWNSDYHLNINLQMNYWPAEVCHLPECHEPLFDLAESLVEPGRVIARNHYACRGFVAHHLTDAWGYTAPADNYSCGLWPFGGAWLCLHFYEHWLFSRSQDFLEERAMPILREAALFLLDYLVELPDGTMITVPSSSPENSYFLPNGHSTAMCVGSTADMQICREVFQATLHGLESARKQPGDEDFILQLRAALTKLPPTRLGSDGRIMEWQEEYAEVEPGHRHISHLFGLHPGTQISPAKTPELAEGAKRTLQKRLAFGGAHTGWSRAWLINFYARLCDGNTAREHLVLLLRKSILSNLLDDHPPFEIDGNFGACAGVAEMLVQSELGEVRILPALPAAWASGSVKGLRCRGGLELEMQWCESLLQKVSFKSTHSGRTAISSPGVSLGHKAQYIWHHQPGDELILEACPLPTA